ncbi:hypothetical protein BDR05DRAFT_700934 [Suillus weaverae]|nr:hypothetical protein BDR05DRAFT_700934 [Suillus weaverae]
MDLQVLCIVLSTRSCSRGAPGKGRRSLENETSGLGTTTIRFINRNVLFIDNIIFSSPCSKALDLRGINKVGVSIKTDLTIEGPVTY